MVHRYLLDKSLVEKMHNLDKLENGITSILRIQGFLIPQNLDYDDSDLKEEIKLKQQDENKIPDELTKHPLIEAILKIANEFNISKEVKESKGNYAEVGRKMGKQVGEAIEAIMFVQGDSIIMDNQRARLNYLNSNIKKLLTPILATLCQIQKIDGKKASKITEGFQEAMEKTKIEVEAKVIGLVTSKQLEEKKAVINEDKKAEINIESKQMPTTGKFKI